MTDQPPSTAPADPPPRTFTQTLGRWTGIAVGVILLLFGALQLLLAFTLPACSDKRATDTLHTIFRQQKITINKISDHELVSEGESDRICSAVVDAPGEIAHITYRIFWEGWTVKVMVGEVKSQPT